MTPSPLPRGCEAAFPETEFAQRQARARAALAAAGFEALVVTGPENIFWLTGRQTAGYFAFQALVLPLEGAPQLLVRLLEAPGAAANTFVPLTTWADGESPAGALAALLARMGLTRPALERQGWFVSPDMIARIEAAVGAGPLPDGSGLLEPLRMVKSAAERAAIRTAAVSAEAGMRAALDTCRAGVSENDIAAAMLSAATRAGSEAMAMEPLVSSGPRSGLPHMTWRRRVLESGDPVFLELAGSHARYHAALMRSVWIGTPPAEARAMMDCALEALAAALAAIRPGAPCSASHDAAQAVIDAAGHTSAFGKRIGYSMGVAFAPDWGEGAVLSLFTGVETELREGMVFHLPATLRAFGTWTVGASETVIVTATGCEPLSALPRDIAVR
ncbi:aminopeptidase P family protein [Paroceanicella profunda]|uniref:Aminopeptidase P family protein n=1 Tax=Paroceanicella profunda TaxID=2579971 RepID=A0A5B8FVK6_9RHOB|nr:Xaa-Pro peptidase family protein [Paroceanicella profunda]QDL91170.1 aminopeptidase P family protein [Paroceanicella profunda]